MDPWSLLGDLGGAFSSGWDWLGQNLGGAMGNPNEGALTAMLQLLGIGSGAYGAYEQQSNLDQILGNQRKAINTAMNPQKMNALIQSFRKYMTPTQTRAILGPVEQGMAARGENQSPGTMQILSEQALAPYDLAYNQQATADAFQSLGFPFQQSAPTPSFMGFNPVGEMGAYGNPFGPMPPNIGNVNYGGINPYDPNLSTSWGGGGANPPYGSGANYP